MFNHFSFHKLLVFLGLRPKTDYRDPLTRLVIYIDVELARWIESEDIEKEPLVIYHKLLDSIDPNFVVKLTDRYKGLLAFGLASKAGVPHKCLVVTEVDSKEGGLAYKLINELVSNTKLG